jgi:hypothetical protein
LSPHEFRIDISPGFASYSYGEHEAEPEDQHSDVRLPDDRLALETAKLLESWLNVWDRISTSNLGPLQTVLKPGTFKIMGEHLWNLILDNEIGVALKARIQDAEDPPLPVLINFDNRTPKDLRSLPWEFLCVPDTEIFLAAETKLMLTRYASSPPVISVSRVERAIDKLGVLFVTALPRSKRYHKVRERVHHFARQLETETGLDVPPPIDDTDGMENALKDPSHPCHVVHITGLCRGEPDKPELWIDTDTGPRWQDPVSLVDALFPKDGKSPRLVVLELCETEEGDADENFERLAPALIRRGVPAVLAMQYVLPPDDPGGVWTKFYRDLAAGMSIGRAVQSSRYGLYHGRGPNRDFGTPVLYLREDGVLIQQPPARPATEGQAEHSGASIAPSGPGSIQRALRQALARDMPLYSSNEFQKGKELLDSLTPTTTVEEARDKIRSFTWQHDDKRGLQQMGLKLAEVLSSLEGMQGHG